MKDLALYALDLITGSGADYGDVRYRSTDKQFIMTQNDVLKNLDDYGERGIGVRVMIAGRWGFAATPRLDRDAVARTVDKAVEIAKAAAAAVQEPIKLTELKARKETFRTEIVKDPFEIPVKEKAELLFEVYRTMSAIPEIKKVTGMMRFKKMHQILVTTEGSVLENEVYTSSAEYTATAVSQGEFQTRTFSEYPKTKGYEWIESLGLVENAERIGREAVEKLKAGKPAPGKKDLILMPSHLALTIHESVGHPTELDRVLGWEANFAGTSFATTEKRGSFRYGSGIVNIVADNTLDGGLATWGWDDDGVPGQRWHIIKDGILTNYGTTRETAHYIGDRASFGCNRADSFASQPINRIPNLGLMPGREKLSLEELIADTDDGILIEGMGSFSIDQRRYNFQFGGDMFHEIKDGKITRPLKDVIYQAITPQFWNSCDAICDERFWEGYGVLNCGKGEPGQIQQMTHGSAPARFRNIDVGGAFNG